MFNSTNKVDQSLQYVVLKTCSLRDVGIWGHTAWRSPMHICQIPWHPLHSLTICQNEWWHFQIIWGNVLGLWLIRLEEGKRSHMLCPHGHPVFTHGFIHAFLNILPSDSSWCPSLFCLSLFILFSPVCLPLPLPLPLPRHACFFLSLIRCLR